MTRIPSPALALVLLVIAAGPALAQSGSGDVTGDGMVNVSDVQATINQALGTSPQTPQADVNGDGVVNVQDVQGIINIALGLVPVGVTNVTPAEPAPGDPVTIEAAGLSPDPAQNLVDFNGLSVPATGVVTGGGGAPIAITLTLPVGARPGPMTVTVGGNALPPFPLNVRASLLVRVGPLPVTGASVEAFAVSGGARGASLGSATTDGAGLASIFFAADPTYSGPVLVELSGGDRLRLDSSTAPLTATWRGALDARAAGTAPDLFVSPLSALAVAAAEACTGGLSAATIPAAGAVLRARLSGLDPGAALPDPRSAPGAASVEQQEAALLCLALDPAAPLLGSASADTLVSTLSLDLADGALDGLGAGGTVVLPEQGVIPTLARAAFQLTGAAGLDPAYALREATLQSLLTANPSLGDPSLPGLDEMPPQVLGIAPLHGSEAVPTDARPVIAFSRDVDPASLDATTVRLFDGATERLVSRSFDGTEAILTLTPSDPLPAGRELTLTIAGVRDLAGNALEEPVTARFTVGGAAALPPTLVSESPPAGSIIDPGSTLRLEFSAAMHPADVAAAGGLTLVVTEPGQLPVAAPIRVGAVPGGRDVVVVPVKPLPAGASLRGDGVAVLGATPTRTWTVRAAGTADTTAPELSPIARGLAERDDGRQRFAVSEALDPASLSGRLTLLENTRSLTGRARLDGSRGLLCVESAEPILAESDLTIQLAAGLRDFAGLGTAPLTLTREVRGLRAGLAWREFASLPVGLPAELQLAGQGGVAPYLFFVAGGALPAGLSLMPDGHIQGTPTVPGSAAFEVAVIDAGGAVAVEPATLTVGPAPGTATLSFAQTRIRVPNEQVGAVTFGVELTTAAPTAFSLAVGIEAAGGTVRLTGSGADVGPTTLSAFFPAGSASGAVVNLSLNIIDDGLYEAEESLRLRLGSVAGAAAIGGRPELVIELVDDEPEPELAFASAATAVAEEGGPVGLTVAASGPSSRRIRGELALSGDADRPGDITVSPDDRISLAALSGGPGGQATLTLTPVDDAELESDESLVLDLVAVEGARAGTPSRHIATVLDDDSRATISVAAVTVDEGAGVATLTVTLSEITSGPVSVLVTVDSAGLADATDFTAVSETVTIPAGQLTANVSVPILEDAINEPDEDLTVTLSMPVGARVGFAGAITITDNDPVPTVAFLTSDLSAVEDDGAVSFEVGLSNPSASPVTVGYGATGTAILGDDLTLSPASPLTIPGVASGGAPVPISLTATLIDDAVDELTETLTVTLMSPTGAGLGAATTVTLTLLDDDAPPQLMIQDLSVAEGVGSADLTISIAGLFTQPVTVDVAVVPQGPASSGDLGTLPMSLTIPAGGATATLALPVVDDTLNEPDELFLVQLLNPVGATLTDGEAQLTITDNDTATVLATPFLEVTEGGTGTGGPPFSSVATSLAFALDRPSQGALRFELTTAGGTAGAGDFTALNAEPVTFAPGATMATAVLNVTADTIHEDDETLSVVAANLQRDDGAGFQPGNLTLALSSVPVTIRDDDTLMVTIADIDELEGDQTRSVVVVVDFGIPSESGASVTINTGDISATAGSDYTALSGATATLTANGQTRQAVVLLEVLGDTELEVDESLTITASAPVAAGQRITLGRPQATVRLRNDESISRIDTLVGDGTTAAPTAGAFGPKSALARPQGLAVDSAGNIYVASELQDRVLRIDPFGVVTVVAGDGDEDSDGDGGLAVDASVGRPQGLAVDGAFLYIAEGVSNGGVRRVDLGSGLISRIATVNGIEGMALDGSGNLVAARPSFQEVVRIDVATGTSTRVAGTGSFGTGADGVAATSSALRSPTGVHVDSNGDILIADTFSHRIRRVDSATGLITTIAGNGVQGFEGDGGPALQARLDTPRDVTRGPAGELIISDSANDRVRIVDAAGDIFTVVGGGASLGDGGPAGLAQLIEPRGLLLDSDGVLYVGDYSGHRVRAVVGLGPLAIARTILPAVSIDSSYQGAIPASGGSNMGFTWSLTAGSLPNGVTLGSGTPEASLSGLARETGVFDITVAVQDSLGATASRVFRIPQGGLIVNLLEPESGSLNGVAVSRSGDVYLSQTGGRLGVRVEGSRRTVLLRTATTSERIVAVREATDEVLYLATNLFAVHTRTGVQRGLVANADDAAVDSVGRIFVCDEDAHRVRTIAPDGTITNFAGNGTDGYGGDGGPALAAALSFPDSIVANDDVVFIGDRNNRAIRRVERATGVITTAVGGPGATQPFPSGGAALNILIPSPLVFGLDGMSRVYFGSSGGTEGMARLASPGVVEPVSNGSVAMPNQTPAIDFRLRTLFKMPFTAGNTALLIPDATSRRLVELSGFERSASLQITGAPRRFAVVGMDYSTSIEALSPEEQGYTWQVTGGALPPGVQLAGGIPAASLSGTPMTSGAYAFTLAVTDSLGRSAQSSFEIIVFDNPVAIRLTDSVIATGASSLVNDELVLVDQSTTTLSKLNLPGTAVLSFASNMPVEHGLTYDPAGNRYIGTSATDDRIRSVSGAGGMATILAGSGVEGFSGDGGPAAMAQLHDPRGTALDASGVLYIADSGNHRIRVIDTSGTITTLVGTGAAGFGGDGGPALMAQLDTPLAVHIDGNRLLIADSGNFRLRAVDLTTGVITTIAGTGVEGTSGDDGPALSAELRRVSAIVTDAAGGIIFADDVSETRIRRIDPVTGVIRLMAGGGTGTGERVSGELIRLDGVRDLDVDRIGRIIVPSPGTGEVRMLGF